MSIANLWDELTDGSESWSQKETDSVIEDDFWWFLGKTKLGHAGAEAQARVDRYRVDALVDCDGSRVVVELDGKAYHDKKRDAVRDREIIKGVDAIIRIPFASIFYSYHATFRVLESWFPRFGIAHDIHAIELADFMREVNDDRSLSEMGISKEQFADECGYQVYHVNENDAVATSARAIVRGHLVDRITIQRRLNGR